MSVCVCVVVFFFFKQKTAYEMRISDWSSDVCSSDLRLGRRVAGGGQRVADAGLPDVLHTRDDVADLTRRKELRRLHLRADDADLEDVEIGRASCRERVCQYV